MVCKQKGGGQNKEGKAFFPTKGGNQGLLEGSGGGPGLIKWKEEKKRLWSQIQYAT